MILDDGYIPSARASRSNKRRRHRSRGTTQSLDFTRGVGDQARGGGSDGSAMRLSNQSIGGRKVNSRQKLRPFSLWHANGCRMRRVTNLRIANSGSKNTSEAPNKPAKPTPKPKQEPREQGHAMRHVGVPDKRCFLCNTMHPIRGWENQRRGGHTAQTAGFSACRGAVTYG